MPVTKVPFVDLALLHKPIRDEIDDAVKSLIDSNSFALGDAVEEFQDGFAEYCGCEHALGVSSGTAALHLALLAHGVGEGDEVITVPNTFIATVEAISYTGAKPVFVDIDESTRNMDAALLEKAITDKTRAIIPVHLYGLPCDMYSILQVAKTKEIPVIEDACQAHGAMYHQQKMGSVGDVGCFSFYPTKNLGAFGDAGMAVTNDYSLYRKMKALRDHGQTTRHEHDFIGFNYRMDGIQGAVLNVKLKYLDGWNAARIEAAALYDELLADTSFTIPPETPMGCKQVYHLYVIQHRNRWAIVDSLRNRGIGCAIHYPRAIHLQRAYRHLGYSAGDLFDSEWQAKTCLSLPLYPGITKNQIDQVCDIVMGFDYDAD
jgi:dTDP-4-amino-4,6-dideoxygalactose transaminase